MPALIFDLSRSERSSASSIYFDSFLPLFACIHSRIAVIRTCIHVLPIMYMINIYVITHSWEDTPNADVLILMRYIHVSYTYYIRDRNARVLWNRHSHNINNNNTTKIRMTSEIFVWRSSKNSFDSEDVMESALNSACLKCFLFFFLTIHLGALVARFAHLFNWIALSVHCIHTCGAGIRLHVRTYIRYTIDYWVTYMEMCWAAIFSI